MEKRQAPDQEWYTQDDFNAFYGDAGPQAWESARREGAAGEAAQGGTPDVTAAALESVLVSSAPCLIGPSCFAFVRFRSLSVALLGTLASRALPCISPNRVIDLRFHFG